MSSFSGVKMSSVAVKSSKFISKSSLEMDSKQILERYDALGVEWEKCPLRWCSKTGKKIGMVQGKGKEHPDWNGYKMSMGDNLMAVDIDGDCEKCEEISALCDAVCTWKQKTRKGFHYIFKKHPLIKQCQPNRDGVAKIDTRVGKGGCLFVAPSFYDHPDGVVQYKWECIPESIDDIAELPKEVLDYFLTIPDYCVAPKKPTKAPTQIIKELKVITKSIMPQNEIVYPETETETDDEVFTPLTTAPVMDEVENLCSCLTPEWLHSHDNWLRLMMMLKSISSSDEMKEVFLKHSARALAYKDYTMQNSKAWDAAKPNGRISMGSLKHWAKVCNPEKYFAYAKSTYWGLVNQNNSNGWCEIFYNAIAGDILYSNSHKTYYVYDARETLWRVSENNAHINFLFVEQTSNVFRKMIADLPVAKDEEEAVKRKAQLKKLNDAMKVCGGTGVITLVSSFLPALCRSDEDPANYFNQNADLLPLVNGVWKFSEKKLIPYEREHYFTFRIPIAYNAKADTTDIRKASMDWFGQDVDVAKFIQYWIGYCLTGFTNRQDFLIAWGTKAGNGKSLLWGKIMAILLDKYYRTITSDALSTERVGNNDQLFNLNGGRFAFLSEPRRAKGTKIDNEIVKTLTGDESFTVEAKYKNAITFKLQAKFAMACNDMPDLKFEDKGTYRRVKVAEQNCEFIDPSDYENADEEAKEKKRIMVKDDDFIKRLLENVEGLMLWALEGASLYIDNPRMEAPKAMSSARDKAVNEGDVLGIWLRGNITKGKGNLKFKRVKEMLNTQNENFGQRQAGFNKRLKEKLEMLGYEVGGREEKGDQYIKGAIERPEDEEEEEEEEEASKEAPKPTIKDKLKVACQLWNPKK
jgi:P4 family phage/plasmid primase-like protien